jgi:hypothetical protein
MSDWNDRFQLIARCRDCGAERQASNPSASVQTTMQHGRTHRIVIQGFPDVCPRCHNLKEAGGRPQAAEKPEKEGA